MRGVEAVRHGQSVAGEWHLESAEYMDMNRQSMKGNQILIPISTVLSSIVIVPSASLTGVLVAQILKFKRDLGRRRELRLCWVVVT